MIDCLIDCVKLSEIRNFLEVKWEGIKGLSQTFIFAFWSPWVQILFKHETPERRWHDFFHLFKWQGVLKIFEFHLRIFPILKLYATQWFSWEKIKWLLQNIWNMSWEFQRNSNLKSILKLFQFGVIWVLFKLFFSKNKIYGK